MGSAYALLATIGRNTPNLKWAGFGLISLGFLLDFGTS